MPSQPTSSVGYVVNSTFTPNTATNSLLHPLALYSRPQCFYTCVSQNSRLRGLFRAAAVSKSSTNVHFRGLPLPGVFSIP
jgi:hypothetical protein